LIVLTADSDIHKHGVFGSELPLSGGVHIITHWVNKVHFIVSRLLKAHLFD